MPQTDRTQQRSADRHEYLASCAIRHVMIEFAKAGTDTPQPIERYLPVFDMSAWSASPQCGWGGATAHRVSPRVPARPPRFRQVACRRNGMCQRGLGG